MVDPDVAIDGLVARGELLTLTTNEAVTWGYADGVAADLPGVLAATGLAGARVVETAPSLAERVVRFVTDPVAASLLIILAVLLIVGDFFVEGFGLAGAAGLGLLALFFWGHLLAGLTGWEDIALVVLGLALVAVEVFVVPGFGIPGILGLAALLGGLFLAMLGREIQTPEGIERAGLTVAASLLGIVVGVVALLALLPRRRRFGGLVLQAALGDAAGPESTSDPDEAGPARLVRRRRSPAPAAPGRTPRNGGAAEGGERSLAGTTGVARPTSARAGSPTSTGTGSTSSRTATSSPPANRSRSCSTRATVASSAASRPRPTGPDAAATRPTGGAAGFEAAGGRPRGRRSDGFRDRHPGRRRRPGPRRPRPVLLTSCRSGSGSRPSSPGSGSASAR
jgi:hypothetical protein